MSQSSDSSSLLAKQAEPSWAAFTQEGGSNLPSLIAAAIAIGRMPGEPAAVLYAKQRLRLLADLVGSKAHASLADPRLEVIRAISASLTRGIGVIRADLVAAAANVGWTRDDLSLMFPAVPLRAVR